MSTGDAAPAPHMDAGGIRVATILGIPVYVTRAWFIVAAIATLIFQSHLAVRVPGLGGWSYVYGAGLFLLLYVSVFLHELGHSLVARSFGLPVRRITLQLLGGVSEIQEESPTPGKEFAVSVAGPIVSLALGAVGYVLLPAFDIHTVPGSIVESLAWSNLLIGVFNLLPGLPLDGGHVLGAVLWKVLGDRRRATIAGAMAGRVVAVLVAVATTMFGLVILDPPAPFTLVFGLMIAWFIWTGASQALMMTTIRDRIATMSVRALTRRAMPVAGDLPLSEAVRQAHLAGAGALVVVDHDGTPTAVVSEDAVAATPEGRRPWMRVADVARRVVPGLQVSTAFDGDALLDAMRAHPASEYLVVEPGGAVYGVLATKDVERALTRATA